MVLSWHQMIFYYNVVSTPTELDEDIGMDLSVTLLLFLCLSVTLLDFLRIYRQITEWIELKFGGWTHCGTFSALLLFTSQSISDVSLLLLGWSVSTQLHKNRLLDWAQNQKHLCGGRYHNSYARQQRNVVNSYIIQRFCLEQLRFCSSRIMVLKVQFEIVRVYKL